MLQKIGVARYLLMAPVTAALKVSPCFNRFATCSTYFWYPMHNSRSLFGINTITFSKPLSLSTLFPLKVARPSVWTTVETLWARPRAITMCLTIAKHNMLVCGVWCVTNGNQSRAHVGTLLELRNETPRRIFENPNTITGILKPHF